MNRLQILQAGYYQSCAYINQLICWGSNEFGESSLPSSLSSDYLLYLSIGRHYACSLTNPSQSNSKRSVEESGKLMCWGNNDQNQLRVDSKMVRQNVEMVRAGDQHTCAKGKVELVCWGKNDHGQVDLNGEYRLDVFSFSVRRNSTCVVSNSDLVCFGEMNQGYKQPDNFPMGFILISLGYHHVCHSVNHLICSGDNSLNQIDIPQFKQEETTISLSMYGNHTCAVNQADKDKMNTYCWGDNTQGQTAVTQDSNYVQTAVGENHSCFSKGRLTIQCIGTENQKLNSIPTQLTNYIHTVKAGGYYTCLIRGGQTSCMGKNKDKLNMIPERFIDESEEIALGQSHVCASRTKVGLSSTLACWGLRDKDKHLIAPPNDYIEQKHMTTNFIDSGFKFTCVTLVQIKETEHRDALCWGSNDQGQTDIPTEVRESPFLITTGTAHACGINTQNRLQCWGRPSHGDEKVPECIRSNVVLVESGNQHNCALSMMNQGECWGSNGKGQTDIPKSVKNFIQKISAGGDFSCALYQADQRLVCWGGVTRTAQVPKGQSKDVLSLSLGQDHICVQSKKGYMCWGGNEQGQSDIEGKQNLQF